MIKQSVSIYTLNISETPVDFHINYMMFVNKEQAIKEDKVLVLDYQVIEEDIKNMLLYKDLK